MTQFEALAILKTGANVFLTGEPGSGKTYVINQYVAFLRGRGIEPAITASTGIAATHIGGMTIHSWSGIGIKTKLEARDLHKIASSQYIAKRVRRAKVLIVEEVSMLAPETLSMVDAVCRKVTQRSEPYGGVQVVFSGDFFQLPPVVKRDTANDDQIRIMEASPARFAYDSHAWKELNPFVCYLTEQYRQDDGNFLDLLSALRRNAFNIDHLRQIEARRTHPQAVPKDAPKLYTHNIDVDRINDEVLAKLPDEPSVFPMSAQGPEALVAALKKGCLSPEMLYLKVGAAVMFTKNNPKEGFVNGTIGVIEGFSKTSGYPIVKARSGRQIAVEPMDWAVEENGTIRAQITQLPLRLAWAITVHKSQGMTLDQAVVDLSGVFEFGQGYVALSRVRRLSDLYILGWNERAFRVHPDIVAIDEVFRQASGKAEAAFSAISPVELQKRHDTFISNCGGKPKSMKEVKSDTYMETLTLWNQGKTTREIAQVRTLSESTIFEHIQKLVARDRINRSDLRRILTPSLAKVLPKIHAAFVQLDTDRLSPIFEKFHGEYSYDELKIARILR